MKEMIIKSAATKAMMAL